MADDKKPKAPDDLAGAHDASPDEPTASAEGTPGGKLIQADVFLSRLAERQEERGLAEGEASVVDAILGALESLGFDPDIVAPGFVRMARKSPVEEQPAANDGAEPPGLEDMAVEEHFLRELHAGQLPSLEAYMRRHAAQRDVLLRLATRMDPAELAGIAPPEALTLDQEAAARAGQEEGARRALHIVAKRSGQRRRVDRQRIAEEQAPYDASHPPETMNEKPARGRKRARPIRPDETRPDG